MTNRQQRLAIIFQTWADLYAENPDAFSEILDADGKAVSDYGESCALHFEKLENKLAEKGLLPLPDGICRVCGCTDDDCSGCIEATGEPCHWSDSSRTLCSACAGESITPDL